MSYSPEDESCITAILSADIITRGIHTKAHCELRKENSSECCNMVRSKEQAVEYNSGSAFLLKNAYCIIVNNDGLANSKTEDLPNYYDRKILELRRFLEQIAKFAKIKLYQNQTGVNFLRIFESLTHDPQLEEYDGFICFVLCENEATFLKRRTPESVDIQGAVSVLTKTPQFDKKPKLFFVEEVMKTEKQNHHPLLTEVGNEFLLVHDRSTLSNEGLLQKLPELFQEFSDHENILAMLARRSCYSTLSTQVCSLSKPVVFANCYCRRKDADQ